MADTLSQIKKAIKKGDLSYKAVCALLIGAGYSNMKLQPLEVRNKVYRYLHKNYSETLENISYPEPENKLEGIVEVDGVYYYYKAGVKQIGAGVVEMKDEQGETFYIYVKSDGTLATGKYWPTRRNDLQDRGEYDWGTDGKYYPGK